MKLTQKTLDVLDAGISDKYDTYIASPPEMRERFFTESFWLDAKNWETYHAQLSSIPFNWKEFKYSDITASNQIENIITTKETGVYMFLVKPHKQIYDMPKFVLYIGIAGEKNKSRPVRDRLKDYFNFNSVKKRGAIIRLLQKYYKNIYIAYSLLNLSTIELKSIETSLLGFFYPKPNKDDFPPELKPIKNLFNMKNINKDKMVLPCLRGVIGGWVYYSSLMSAKQINEWIDTAKEIREAKILDDHLQRTLKERKFDIANYLLKNESRFFNSIIVGIFDSVPDWLEFDLDKAADIIGSSESMKNIKESVGLMIFNGHEKMFAIDGQHRVAGIKIAFEKDKEEELIDDQFSVIFVAHIDDPNGKKKTRRLFSDINKKAVPVAKGDRIIIDEDDLSAIVTRRIYSAYPKFLNGEIISLTENAKLEENDIVNFTNLLSIYTVCKNLKIIHKKNKKIGNLDEENIEAFKLIVYNFFDWAIKNFEEYQRYFVLNNFTLSEARKENKHLLFRPVGLSLVAKLYAYFFKTDKLEMLVSHLDKLNLTMPDSPFNKILWNNGKMEAASTNLSLAFDLSKYLLGEPFTVDQIKILTKKYIIITKNDDAILPNRFI